MGLKFDASKSRVIPSRRGNASHKQLFVDYRYLEAGDFEFLGAAFGSQDFTNQELSSRMGASREILQRAADLNADGCGLHIIRQCLSYCKVSYAIRVNPPHLQEEALVEFNRRLRGACEGLLGDQILDPKAWKQIQLSIAQGD